MSSSETLRSGGTFRHRGVLAALVLFAVCLAACLFLGISWALAANDESVGYAAERDQALQDGRSAITTFNTLDHRDVQHGLDQWEQSSAGQLRDEVRQGRQNYAGQIAQAKSTTTAKVLDAGIVELDERAGKARMIAVVQVTVAVEGQQPTVKRDRYQAELTREGATWKLSGLGAVPAG
jgi:Mce-associated membrane protein